MNITISSRTLFILCFILVIGVNSLLLSMVFANRNGEIESEPVLTERELSLSETNRENSGQSLRLVWRTLPEKEDDFSYRSRPAWLDSKKLEDLGFDLSPESVVTDTAKTYYKERLPKAVYLVLENDGLAYKESLRRAEEKFRKEEAGLNRFPEDEGHRNKVKDAKEFLQRERVAESRLFAIDAGLDARELRKKYQDRKQILVIRGMVKPFFDNEGKISGTLLELSSGAVHIPFRYRQFFDPFLTDSRKKRWEIKLPRFEVTLAFGQRHEPWISSVRSLEHMDD